MTSIVIYSFDFGVTDNQQVIEDSNMLFNR